MAQYFNLSHVWTLSQVEKGSVWTFEQTQALELFNVFIPVRMTVIKLKSGGIGRLLTL